jgi:hypothetical protein
MFKRMVLRGVSGEVGRLENAMKRESIRINTKTAYYPFRHIAELGKCA